MFIAVIASLKSRGVMDVVEIPDKAQQSVLLIEPHTHLQLTLDMCSQQIGTLNRYMLVEGTRPVEYASRVIVV